MLLLLPFLVLLSVPIGAIRIPPEASKSTWTSERLNHQEEKHSNLRRLFANNDDDESHRVTEIPLLQEGTEIPTNLYSGHIAANAKGNKQIFYILVAPKEESQDDAPLLIWLNGGPGCSSMDGFFLENGPLAWNRTSMKLITNPYSWHLAPAWVLYVDQPVGTGLSFTQTKDYDSTDEQVDQDFLYFIRQFLLRYKTIFLEEEQEESSVLTTRHPVYFSGESHAGHYIPSMMRYFQTHSNVDNENAIRIKLGGAAIGNGWISPFYQYSPAQFAYQMGLISLDVKTDMDKKERSCQDLLKRGQYKNKVCLDILTDVLQHSNGTTRDMTVSMYDVRKLDFRHPDQRIFPQNHDLVEAYLGDKHKNLNLFPSSLKYTNVLESWHASRVKQVGQQYEECAYSPFRALEHQDGLGVTKEIATLLEQGMPMLFYNGMYDMICDHISQQDALANLPWDRAPMWAASPDHAIYNVTGTSTPEPDAYVKEYENLIYLKIENSGHMVPLDQPEVALRMISNFLNGKSFLPDQKQSTGGDIDF